MKWMLCVCVCVSVHSMCVQFRDSSSCIISALNVQQWQAQNTGPLPVTGAQARSRQRATASQEAADADITSPSGGRQQSSGAPGRQKGRANWSKGKPRQAETRSNSREGANERSVT